MAMPKIEFRCQMFRGDWDQVWSQRRMLWLMEALVRVNQTHLQEFEAFKKRGLVANTYPSVYRSGLHYETEKGTEIWPDIPSLIEGVMGQGIYPGIWGDCLPMSTLVLMADYTVKAVGGLIPGDLIMGDGHITKVLEQAITGEKPILAFDLNNGATLKCSPEHRLFLRDDTEKRAEDVRPGDLLKTPTTEFGAFDSSPSFGLASKDFAWLLGVFVADGWTDYPRHPRFCISGKDGHKKEEQKRRVQSLIEKISSHTRRHERYIGVTHKEMAAYMSECGHRAPNKHLPSLIFSRDQAEAVIEGLATDAATSSSGTRTFSTTSEILTLQLRILLRMVGRSCHIKRWDDHGGLGENPIYRITERMPGDPLYPDARRDSVRVVGVRECEPELCCDITTDTGRFYLPESDTIVHNCEDLSCYRTAELRELPFHFERPSKLEKGKTEYADPRFPQEPSAIDAQTKNQPWPGWKVVKGGIPAKPFAKWRRGPQGQYHYHALTWLPDGRLEDPSLVLGMGKEKEFADANMAERLKSGEPVVLQYAKKPDVMVVDPEKPSGYNGGISKKLDAEVLKKLAEVKVSGDDLEKGAYLANPIPVSSGAHDLDALMGWSRQHRAFVPHTVSAELRRLKGYAR